VVHEQPGVSIGDATHCAVSGVVFVVEDASPKKRVGDRDVYFCCDSCLAYFDEHGSDVMAKRGWN